MTTTRRPGRPMPVDLMFGGDEAEALFESWLGDDAGRPAGPPVRVADVPAPQPQPPQPPSPPEGEGGGDGPLAWRPPAPPAPLRRPR